MKPKNYTDKSAMLVGTDADPVTAGPKHFALNLLGDGLRDAFDSKLN